jgi:hypothetical protein
MMGRGHNDNVLSIHKITAMKQLEEKKTSNAVALGGIRKPVLAID